MNGQSAKPLELETWMQDVHQFSCELKLHAKARVPSCGAVERQHGSGVQAGCCAAAAPAASATHLQRRCLTALPPLPCPSARSRQQLQAASHAGGGAPHAGGCCLRDAGGALC